MPIHRKRIGDAETSALTNICRAAAERFEDYARDLRESPSKETFHLSGEAAQRLADQFKHQAQEARDFASVFDAAGEFHIPMEDATNG